MNQTGKIHILIADDFKVLRDVIRLHLGEAEDMEVVGEAPDLHDALERARALQPDVIIMNGDLPPLDSAHAAELLRAQGTTAAILVISMKTETDLIQRSFRQGANGFMHKDEIDDCLVEAIRTIYRGDRYLSAKAQEANGSISG